MAEILMPRLSDTMEEGTVARWLKQPGDPVTKGEVIAEIQTDKANMDLEAYEGGTLQQLLVEEGATVPIGQPIAVIGTGPAPSSARPAPAQPSVPAPVTPDGDGVTNHVTPSPPRGPSFEAGRDAGIRRSSPLARSLARSHGLALTDIAGTGPGGRIIRADVEAIIAQHPRATGPSTAPPIPQPATPGTAAPVSSIGDDDEEVLLTAVRRITAERLTQSSQAPHFYLTSVIDAEPLLTFRAEANDHLDSEGNKVTVTDLLVKACANQLRAHPEINASWGEDKLIHHHHIHIGIAVAVPDGLIVPVIHHADRKTLAEIAAEARSLSETARQSRLSLEQISGGTFTISNLGMYGIDHFTAIINPPQAAILAVGAATPTAVVRDGQVVAGTTMKFTLAIDHRVLDGATAARFLTDLRQTLEKPLRIVM